MKLLRFFKFLLLLVTISEMEQSVAAVDESKFKKCQESAFCTRQRSFADIQHELFPVQPSRLNLLQQDARGTFFHVQPDSLKYDKVKGKISAVLVKNSLNITHKDPVKLDFILDILEDNSIRYRILPYGELASDNSKKTTGAFKKLFGQIAQKLSSPKKLSKGAFPVADHVLIKDPVNDVIHRVEEKVEIIEKNAGQSEGSIRQTTEFYFGREKSVNDQETNTSSYKLSLVSTPYFYFRVHDADGTILLSTNKRNLLASENVDDLEAFESPDTKSLEFKKELDSAEKASEEAADAIAHNIHDEKDLQDRNHIHEELKKNTEENFGGFTDNHPAGPMSVGLDVIFHGTSLVYGLPQHSSTVNLKTTRGTESEFDQPYRLYNLDVFEYKIDSPMAIYGSIPFVVSLMKNRAVGMFWANSAEAWVDVYRSAKADNEPESTYTELHWMFETPPIDVFLIFASTDPGNQEGRNVLNPLQTVLRNYGALTGTTPLPPLFSIAYSQCRWNYNDQKDVEDVDENFDKHDIPVDVLWLDIEHTDGKRYFTWDKSKFPDPIQMQNKLAAKGRQLVTIVDPHLKIDEGYRIFKEAKEKDLLIKDVNGNQFEGWCWPGNSAWTDYVNPQARKWWSEQFQYEKYEGSTENLFIWNDMNEPSIFTGPEVTMPKNAIHYGGFEHRHLHNIYGMLMHWSTFVGLLNRAKNSHANTPLVSNTGSVTTNLVDRKRIERPFVLSRAFFAGSQKFGAIWTGDNAAKWEHLEASVPMLLSHGIAGLPFCGADVGGFFGDPEPELLVRWYQLGAFYPFFRAHAHIDTKRREPWVYAEPYLGQIRSAIRTRYELLPYFYTVFKEAADFGLPVMRPMFLEYPNDPSTFDLDDQFLLGRNILVKPVVSPGQKTVKVYIPQDEVWYHYHNLSMVAKPKMSTLEIETNDNWIPTFLRGGSIIPKFDRFRRSSTIMWESDPLTLVILLDSKGFATGNFYMDDGRSLEYMNGDYVYRSFKYEHQKLSVKKYTFEKGVPPLTAFVSDTESTRNVNGKFNEENGYLANGKYISKIVIVGSKSLLPEPKKIAVFKSEGTLEAPFTWKTIAYNTVVCEIKLIEMNLLLSSVNWQLVLQ